MTHSRWPSAAKAFTQAQSKQRQALFGLRQPDWIARTQNYLDLLQPFTAANQFPRILLVQSAPIEFLAAFTAACIADCPVFLGNPAWSQAEWEQVGALVQPHLVWGTLPTPVRINQSSPDIAQRGWIMIPTGGSSGGIKFAIHTWQTLSAAVAGFQTFFCEGQPIHSCCVLPLYHVSGLMQFLRSFLTGGQFVILHFVVDLSSSQSVPSDLANFLERSISGLRSRFLSLVPTQLQRLLEGQSHLPWLQEFSTILLGGAPAWPALLEQGRALGLNLAPTYGMTETAAQIATLRPAEFLQGHPSSGRCLPHAQVTVQSAEGRTLGNSQIGVITVQAKSLFHGYYPEFINDKDWTTDDVGFLDSESYLSIVGRNSRKILSGGENIFPEEVEAALLATKLVREVCVIGIQDSQWGEAVTALYVPIDPSQSEVEARLKAALRQTLSRYKHPKRWICVDCIPYSAQGKLNYRLLLEWIKENY